MVAHQVHLEVCAERALRWLWCCACVAGCIGLAFGGLSSPFVLLLVICEAVEGQGALSSVMACRRLLVLVARRL